MGNDIVQRSFKTTLFFFPFSCHHTMPFHVSSKLAFKTMSFHLFFFFFIQINRIYKVGFHQPSYTKHPELNRSVSFDRVSRLPVFDFSSGLACDEHFLSYKVIERGLVSLFLLSSILMLYCSSLKIVKFSC